MTHSCNTCIHIHVSCDWKDVHPPFKFSGYGPAVRERVTSEWVRKWPVSDGECELLVRERVTVQWERGVMGQWERGVMGQWEREWWVSEGGSDQWVSSDREREWLVRERGSGVMGQWVSSDRESDQWVTVTERGSDRSVREGVCCEKVIGKWVSEWMVSEKGSDWWMYVTFPFRRWLLYCPWQYLLWYKRKQSLSGSPRWQS